MTILRVGASHLAFSVRVVCTWYIEYLLTAESIEIFAVAEPGLRILCAGAFPLAVSIRAVCTWYIESLLTPESIEIIVLANAGARILRAGAFHLNSLYIRTVCT